MSMRDFSVAAGLLAAAMGGYVLGRTGIDIKVPTGIVSVPDAKASALPASNATPKSLRDVGTSGLERSDELLRPIARNRLSEPLEDEIQSFSVHLESHIGRIWREHPSMFVEWKDENGLADVRAMAENARRFQTYVANLPKDRPVDNLGNVAAYCVTKSGSLMARASGEAQKARLELTAREP